MREIKRADTWALTQVLQTFKMKCSEFLTFKCYIVKGQKTLHLLKRILEDYPNTWSYGILTWKKANYVLQISNQIISSSLGDRKSPICLQFLWE